MPRKVLNIANVEAVAEVLAKVRAELNVPEEYPAAAVEEARRAASGAPELAARAHDRREIPFVTIDPESSMDLDQAVHFSREGEGYLVRYAISAVGLYVQPGGPLDSEIQRRGRTMYGPDRSIPLHPVELSHGVASILPGQDTLAYLWYLHLDSRGELAEAWVELSWVRSVAKLSYVGVQRAADGEGLLPSEAPGDLVELLREVGTKRLECEARRGGISLAIPEQQIERDGDSYHLAFRTLTDVEKWNAQISLATGMAAAKMMFNANIGVLRTMPAARDRDVDYLRTVAQMLGLDWAREESYPDFVRTVNAENPAGAAFLEQAAGLFRGAGYLALPVTAEAGESDDGQGGSGRSGRGRHGQEPVLTHAALAAPYSHVTAPLRRLVDRYGLEVCRCLCAGEEIPAWVREGLERVPEQMAATSRAANVYERRALNTVEALVLRGREGEEFDAVVTDVLRRRGGGETRGRVILAEPAIEAEVRGVDLVRGERIRVVLTEANVEAARVEFVPAGR